MRRMRVRNKKAALVTLLVLLLVVVGLAGVVGALRSTDSGGDGGASESADQAMTLGPESLDATGHDGSLADQTKALDAANGVMEEGAAPATDERTAESGSGSTVNGALGPLQNPGQYLIRSGSLELIVGRNRLEESVRRVISITGAFNGYILSSTVGSLPGTAATPSTRVDDPAVETTDDVAAGSYQVAGGGEPYASITVRVPAANFDSALARYQQLGKVRALDTSTEDVTSQIVDLRARLKHYKAVERRLLSFLDKAQTVQAALTVQDRIDETEMMIEEIKAQLKQLDETVSYSTLSISMTETAKKAVVAAHTSTGFWGTIKRSLALVGDGFRMIAIALGAVLPFLVVFGIIGVLVVWVIRRVQRRRKARTGGSDTGTPRPADGPPAAAGGEAV